MKELNQRHVYWLLLAMVVILIDQVTKLAVLDQLHAYQPLNVLPFFNLTLAFNTGAAFSFLSDSGGWHQWFFTVFAIAMSAVLFIWLLRTPKSESLQSCAISLILGGAIGNVIDRFNYGHVIDFLDFHVNNYHWPTFNIADSAICIGAALLIIDMLKNKKN